MIDHVGFGVSDYADGKQFYTAALAPLGYEVVMEHGEAAGFGADGKPDFWISSGGPTRPTLHIALQCADRETVRRFYAAAIKAGATDNGPPGLREHYHPNYYAAFVLDADGNNIEAVCHKAE